MIEPKFPELEQIAAQLWRTLTPIIADLDGYPLITVPAGFETDGASVPRLFWPICPKFSNYTNAAVVHDYLYFHRAVPGHFDEYDRADADRIFLELMRELGVSRWQRWAMYSAVRMFGPRW